MEGRVRWALIVLLAVMLLGLCALVSRADVLRWHYTSEPESPEHAIYAYWSGGQVEIVGEPVRGEDGVWWLPIPACEGFAWDVVALGSVADTPSSNGPLVRESEGVAFCNGDMNGDGAIGLDDVGVLLDLSGMECP